MRTPPRSQGVHHTGVDCVTPRVSGTLDDRGVLVARRYSRTAPARLIGSSGSSEAAAVAVAASARGLAGAAGRGLDPRAGARVVN